MDILEPEFRPAALPPPLPAGEIHLWRVSLDPDEALVGPLRALLTEDERSRADRFVFPIHRRRFTVARAALRMVLGRYAGLAPGDLRFDYGPRGKPALAEESGGTRLRFNLSHSEELALIAVALDQALGVDLEQLRSLSDADAMARHSFSPAENVVFRSVPEEGRLEAFFNAWTRKEAFIKALGEGLSHPLDRFDVSLEPGEPARLLRIDGDARSAAAWSMAAFHPAPGYVGALVAPGRGWRVRCFSWSGLPPEPAGRMRSSYFRSA